MNMSFADMCDDISRFQLDNGLTVYIKEMHQSPVVTADIWVRTGVLNETKELTGCSHFLEHMIFKGTDKIGPGEADKIIDRLGGMNNAATSLDYTHYYVKVGKQNWVKGFEVMAELVTNAAVDPEEYVREKKVVQEEYRRKQDNPSAFLGTVAYHESYENHPYAMEVLGEPDPFQKLTRDQLYAYYKKYYAPNNMAVFIFGDVNTEEALEEVKSIMGDFSGKAPVYTEKHRKVSYRTGQNQVLYKDMRDSHMVMTFPAPSIKDRDVYAMDVLMTILGDGDSSRLNQIIKEEKELAYGIGASYGTQYAPGLIEVMATLDPANKDLLRAEVVNVIKGIQEKGISEEELKKAKKMLQASIDYSAESTASLAGYFGYYYALTGDLKFACKYSDKLAKVSADDVQDIACKYMKLDKANTFYVFPEEMKQQLEPKIELKKEENGIARYDVNGSMVLIKPVPQSRVIAMNISMPFGSAIEPAEKVGVCSLIGSLLSKGTSRRTSSEIAQELEELGASFSVEVKPDYVSIKGYCLAADFDDFQDVFWDMVTNSTFPEDEFEKEQKLQKKSIELRENNHFRRAIDKASEIIFTSTPYQYPSFGTLDSVDNITREDVLSYYRKYFGKRNMFFTVVGHVEKDSFVKEFAQKISMINPGVSVDVDFSSLKDRKESVQEIIEKNIEQSNIIQAYISYPFHDRKKMATLRVLSNILGGGMSSLFFQDLRDTNSLAYTVGTFSITNKEAGALVVYIGTQNERAGEALAGISRIIQSVKDVGISEDLLKKGIDNQIGMFQLGHETCAAQAHYLGFYEVMGLGYEYDLLLEEDVRQVTAEDVRLMAVELFANPVTVIVGNPKLIEK